MNLRQYQIEGIAKLRSFKSQDLILADEPGLGKTAQAIVFACTVDDIRKILVVCPASLRTNWAREIAIWSNDSRTFDVFSYEGVVNNTSSVLDHACDYDLVIFDEAHYLKNPKAKRTKTCLDIPHKYRLFITGTPIVNRPIELYPILSSIGIRMSYIEYGKYFCAGYRQRVTKTKTIWNFNGASNVDTLVRSLSSNIMVRRLKRDVLKELPEKIRTVVDVQTDFTDPASVMDVNLLVGFGELDLTELMRVNFTELSAIRHDLGMAKAPFASDFVRNLLEEEDKVVVFAHHREVIDLICEKLSDFHPVKLYGGMSDKDKQASIDEFQKGYSRVFVGQIEAAGTGITLTASSCVVFAEIDWVPGNITQAEDRCHRLGQKEVVRVFHIVAANTLDSRIAKAIVEKQKTLDSVSNPNNL